MSFGRYCLPLFFLWALLPAQEDLRPRVEQLETQVRQLTEEVLRLRDALQAQQKLAEKLSQKKSPERISLYDDIIAAYQQQTPENDFYAFYRKLIHAHIWLGGYLELQIESRRSSEQRDILDLSSLALSFRSALHDHIAIEGEIRLSDTDQISISHAYLLVNFNSFLNFKAGVIRVPFGRYNSTYSPPAQTLASLPLGNQFLAPAIWSEPGIAVFGKYPERFPLQFTYEVLVSNGLSEDGFDVGSGNREGIQDIHQDNNHDKQWSARIGLIPQLGLDTLALYFGASGVIGRYDRQQHNEYRGAGLDFLLRLGAFSLIGDHDRLLFSGEYLRFHNEYDQVTLRDNPDFVAAMSSYYLQLDYLFFPEDWREWGIIFGKESQFGISFRYEWLDLHTPLWAGARMTAQRTYTIGFHFRPIAQTIFRIEYSRIKVKISSEHDWEHRLLASFATYF